MPAAPRVIGLVVGSVIELLLTSGVRSEPAQQRFYDSRGRSLGNATPIGPGSTRYYDASGRSLGTSSTDAGGSTTLYDSRGNVIGRSTKGHR